MSLVGLQKKSRLCKICNSFDDRLLNEITLDTLLHRKTYKEIVVYYTKLLPAGVKSISETNINNHRKHCDPALIAEEHLRRAGIPTLPGDTVAKLYSMRYNSTLSKVDALQELYKERLKNLEYLQLLLEDKLNQYEQIKLSKAVRDKALKMTLQRNIKSLTRDIDNVQSDLQNVMIKDLHVENGAGASTVNIYNNVVNNFQDSLKLFMDDLVPYLLLNIFQENPELGKRVVRDISVMMDNQLGPVISQHSSSNALIPS